MYTYPWCCSNCSRTLIRDAVLIVRAHLSVMLFLLFAHTYPWCCSNCSRTLISDAVLIVLAHLSVMLFWLFTHTYPWCCSNCSCLFIDDKLILWSWDCHKVQGKPTSSRKSSCLRVLFAYRNICKGTPTSKFESKLFRS